MRDAIRSANQAGSLGAVLGLGGMVLRVPEDEVETPGGSFTLGKAVTDVDCGGVLLDCSSVRVKPCPLKANVRVSLSRSKAWASNSSKVFSVSLIHSPKFAFLLKIQK